MLYGTVETLFCEFCVAKSKLFGNKHISLIKGCLLSPQVKACTSQCTYEVN